MYIPSIDFETSMMPHLEKQIADWRKSMSQACGRRNDRLDELEAHLREEVDGLLRAGMSSDDVFQAAVAKLGTPSALAAEFHKLTVTPRPQWMPVRIARVLTVVFAALSCAMLVRKLGTGKWSLLLGSHVVSVTLGYLAMFVMGGLAICHVCAHFVGRSTSLNRYSFERAIFQFANIAAILTASGIVLGMSWARDNLGRYWAWDLKETGATAVLAWALLISALRWIRIANQIVIPFVGILANVITALAWFGANLGAKALFHPVLSAFIASQLLFLFAVPITHHRQSHRARQS